LRIDDTIGELNVAVEGEARLPGGNGVIENPPAGGIADPEAAGRVTLGTAELKSVQLCAKVNEVGNKLKSHTYATTGLER
jgi:hypothetical protein